MTPQLALSPASTRPWWRESYVWLVISGPAAVVVAGIITIVIAYQGADTVVRPMPVVQGSVQSSAVVPRSTRTSAQDLTGDMLPAMAARNAGAAARK